jgi:methylisocitrate lyase
MNTPGTAYRTLLDATPTAGPIAQPGAFNGLVARAVVDAGFRACYVSGGATSAGAGVPDVGVLTLDRFAQIVREVAQASRTDAGEHVPVLADADTGFGEEEMVRRTVIEYARAGAAGLHLEDQVFPKRCGHLDGKALIPTEHFASKIAWAAATVKDSCDPAFVVCARTDAAGVEGFEAAVERAHAYVEAGAEMIFPEGLKSEGEFERFAGELRERAGRRVWLLANMTEFGKTPMITLDRFGELGYDVVIFPVTMLRIAMGAVTSALVDKRLTAKIPTIIGQMQRFLDGHEPSSPRPGATRR